MATKLKRCRWCDRPLTWQWAQPGSSPKLDGVLYCRSCDSANGDHLPSIDHYRV